MHVIATEIPAVKRVIPKRHGDDRGWFSEIYRADLLAEHGIANTFVQDNQSFSAPAGTIRGLHFQGVPNAQAKLIRMLAGAILDVAVDLRSASPTCGRHVAVRLDAMGGAALRARRLCPRFLHPGGGHHGRLQGRRLLQPGRRPEPALGRSGDRHRVAGGRWPVAEADAILSGKDKAAPLLADLGRVF